MSKISLNPELVHQTLDKYKDTNNPGDGWEELWNKAECLPWDRGNPNPAFEDLLLENRTRAIIGLGPATTTTTTTTDSALEEEGKEGNVEEGKRGRKEGRRRKRALVPGCGRGVDVLLLASFGFDAYGLEYSASAVEVCKREAAATGMLYPVRVGGGEASRGKMVFVQGDFFRDDWLKELGFDNDHDNGDGGFDGFDLIYDYTFFCALDPSMRPAWALRMTQLLAPSPRGNLICLEFPRHKNPSLRGPPWSSSSEAYMEHLSHPGEKIEYDDQGKCKSDPLRPPSEGGLERVAYYQPARTHDVGISPEGEVLDRVSIWRRR